MNTKNRSSSILTVAVVAFLALATTTANAAIVIDDSTTGTYAMGTGQPWVISGWDASGSDKLVVIIGARRNFGTGLTSADVQYNGTSLTPAVEFSNQSPDGALTGIYYLDNPGTVVPGDITVQFNNGVWGNDSGYAVLSLSGTAPGAGPVSSSVGTSTGPFAVGGFGDPTLVLAGAENITNQATPVPQAPLTDLGPTAGLGSGYQFVLSGNVTPTFSETARMVAAAAFNPAATAAVPEPSTLVLGAFGLLSLGMTRRRRRR